MLSDLLSAIESTSHCGIMAWWDKDDLVVEMELPGYEKGKISVFRDGDYLTVDAHKDSVDRKYICHNSRYPEHYQKRLLLPDGMDKDNTDALYDNGILTMKVRKDRDKLSRQIMVK